MILPHRRTPLTSLERLAIPIGLVLLIGCTPDTEQVEPPRLVARVFDASAKGVDAIVYVTREDRRRPGPIRLSRRFDQYALVVRRLDDGAVVKRLALTDTMGIRQDSVPTVLGVFDAAIWLRHDSLVGYALPSLDGVRSIARHAVVSPEVAALHDTLQGLESLPEWMKPGMSRLFTEVSNGLLARDSIPAAARSLPNAGVLMRADRSAWHVNSPASVLVMSREADSTWSLSRVERDGRLRWTTPLGVRFSTAFVVHDIASYVVFTDSESFPDRSGVRERVIWVNVDSGTARSLEVGTGVVASVSPK